MSETRNIETIIENDLSGEMQELAKDFVTHLRAIGMTTPQDNPTYFHYKGEYICNVLPFPEHDGWLISPTPNNIQNGLLLDEDIQEFARANVKICNYECGCSNAPEGGTQTVFGKEYEGTCSSTIFLWSPDKIAIEKCKKLMDYYKLCIDEKQRT